MLRTRKKMGVKDQGDLRSVRLWNGLPRIGMVTPWLRALKLDWMLHWKIHTWK